LRFQVFIVVNSTLTSLCYTSCEFCFADDVYIVYTDENNAFDHVVLATERKFFVFAVQACRSVHLLLTHLPGVVNTLAYDINIGSLHNNRSAIHKLPPDEQRYEFNTDNILSCDAYKVFWTTWSEGAITVGHGNIVGASELFKWSDDSPYSINAVALASRDTEKAVWQFAKESGKHSVALYMCISEIMYIVYYF